MKEKACSKCGIIKPLAAFGKRKGRPRGQSRCKDCAAIYNVVYNAKTKKTRAVKRRAKYVPHPRPTDGLSRNERARLRYKADPAKYKAATKKSKAKYPERVRARNQKWIAKNPANVLWSAAKKRAAKKGLVFDIRVSDIIIPDRCPILGITLEAQHKGFRGCRAPNSPSLDRKNPKLGYVLGNVWVISWRANNLKSDATIEELKLFVAAWERAL